MCTSWACANFQPSLQDWQLVLRWFPALKCRATFMSFLRNEQTRLCRKSRLSTWRSYLCGVTTSIVDEEMIALIMAAADPTKPLKLAASIPKGTKVPIEPVSLVELAERMKRLFTPEEAADLARRIEEGRAARRD
jgi:hypothetical protein